MKKILAGLLLIIPCLSFAQLVTGPSSSQILHEIKKLNSDVRVLYLAAHPDDENTRLITWLANNQRVEVSYLSLTRGDGGQNLIGNEIGPELGLVRTQELLAARKIDGGEQFFTRAIDFGYSKSADESFEIWNKEEITKDIVWIVRNFQPDIIICRFPPNEKAGHGHHTASGILGEEVFELAANPKVYPEQLKYVKPWQVKQLWLNVSTWWDKELPEKAKMDPSILALEVGQYEPLLGRSMGEIASYSRSQHQSQGFGTELQRGTNIEYLQLIKGQHAGSSLFGEERKNWSSYKEGSKLHALITRVEKEFNAEQPELSIPSLIEVAKLFNQLPDGPIKNSKIELVNDIIVQCAGIWFEANAINHEVIAGESIKVDVTLLNRSNVEVKVSNLKVHRIDTLINTLLTFNDQMAVSIRMGVEPNHEPTEQYWLSEPPSKGLFSVNDQMQLLKPESDPTFMSKANLEVAGYNLEVKVPVQYKWVDRAKGELRRNLRVVPEITVNPQDEVVLFPNKKSANVKVMLRAHKGNLTGTLSPVLPQGWQCEPASIKFNLSNKLEEVVFNFIITPSASAATGNIAWNAEVNGKNFTKSEKEIQYDHIPIQNLLYTAQFKAVNFELNTVGTKIGYLMGSGDDGPSALKLMGYEVEMLDVSAIGAKDLSSFDAIITGIRAYNTIDGLVGVNHVLLDYVKNGGNLIVQYNVNRGLVLNDIGPYPFEISRDRVTDETATPTFLDKNHPILNKPNLLSKLDFALWVQERGLYFASNYDKAYEPIISWQDKNEEPKEGALIVAKYGEGAFIYTGISFFRQLPAGAPGAYRLLANIIAYGKDE